MLPDRIRLCHINVKLQAPVWGILGDLVAVSKLNTEAVLLSTYTLYWVCAERLRKYAKSAKNPMAIGGEMKSRARLLSQLRSLKQLPNCEHESSF